MSTSAPPDWQPTLEGSLVRLRPLREDDFDALHAAAADPAIWALHPEPTRWQPEVFRRFFDSGMACGGALVAHDAATGAVIGSSRYYQWDAAQRHVTVGYTFLARSHWGGAVNAEMKRLMLDHAFAWARTVWFEVGVSNWRSRRAMEKIGARLDGEMAPPPGATQATSVRYRIDAPGRP